MKQVTWLWGGILISSLFLFSCSKPTLIGSDLLLEDQLDIQFTDTLSMNAQTVTTDSVNTYDPDFSGQLVGYLCGTFVDPVFGTSTSVINSQFRLNSSSPDFANQTLDSIVLVLPYYASRVYGDTTELYELEVYLMETGLDNSQEYYSNDAFRPGEFIGRAEFIPRPTTPVTINAHVADSLVQTTVVGQVRIPLFYNFAQEFFNRDAAVFETDSSFLANYPGFQIRAGSSNNGMLSFNLRTSVAAIEVYYNQGDTTFGKYNFVPNAISARMVSFDHDYSGSVVESFLNDPALGDSLLFIQGMAGVSAVLEFPDIEQFDATIINRAELELTIATLDEDGGFSYAPIDQLIISQVLDDGTLQVIDDFIFALERQDIQGIFGGFPTDNSPQTYNLNISAHFVDMKNGVAVNKIRISAVTRGEKASRVVVFGPGHSVYPAKLKLSLTNI